MKELKVTLEQLIKNYITPNTVADPDLLGMEIGSIVHEFMDYDKDFELTVQFKPKRKPKLLVIGSASFLNSDSVIEKLLETKIHGMKLTLADVRHLDLERTIADRVCVVHINTEKLSEIKEELESKYELVTINLAAPPTLELIEILVSNGNCNERIVRHIKEALTVNTSAWDYIVPYDGGSVSARVLMITHYLSHVKGW